MTIVLTHEQVQYILTALADRPFKEVADIVQAIMAQASEQTEAA